MIQQCLNKNLTKDDTNNVQKNIGMTKQCWNKNLTKDDTNKAQKNIGTTKQCWNIYFSTFWARFLQKSHYVPLPPHYDFSQFFGVTF